MRQISRLSVRLAYARSPKMSAFIQKLNPTTGQNEWTVQPEDYDFHQEVARASFADMLHDTERNRKYEQGLKSAIETVHSRGLPANVLDIGTGTGLLSMMAARHGADTIHACEAFTPMSQCAQKIIKHNRYEQKICVIAKRSTELVVGRDLPHKCNILVTEVFDTELIGEGALQTFKHALDHLLAPDAIIVPSSGTVYAQIVESPAIQNWNRVKDLYDEDGRLLLETPRKIKECDGSPSVHDLQLSQMDLSLINRLTRPQPIFRFNWNDPNIKFEESIVKKVKCEVDGVAQAVLMWWELEMDVFGDVVLSCAPYWAHPLERGQPWRDHWMQAIYYLPLEVRLEKGQMFDMIGSHDEFSLWFDVSAEVGANSAGFSKPICECGLHVTFSRTRIGQINDSVRNKKLIKVLEANIDAESRVLILGDGSYLSLAAAKFGAKEVCFVETNFLSRKILNEFIVYNKIDNVRVFDSFEALLMHSSRFNVVFGEPYFMNCVVPWDNLLFAYLLKRVRGVLDSHVRVFPKIARIRAIAVEFDDLNKIRMPLGDCEGYDMKHFDDLIKLSSGVCDESVEAQPLWEYPGVASSDPVDLFTLNMENLPEMEFFSTKGSFDLENTAKYNGIAFWMEWDFGANVKVSSGPVLPTMVGEKLVWDVHTRQGVCLFENRKGPRLNSFELKFEEGYFSFKC